MRGRKPLSAEMRALKTDPAKRRAAVDAAQSPQTETAETIAAAGAPTIIEPPDWLTTPRSLEIFKRVVESHTRQRIARQTDVMAFARWAVYMDRWIDIKERLDGKKLTYISKSSKTGSMIKRKDPNFQAMTDLEKVLVPLEDRLGINPTARQSYLRGLAAVPTDKPRGSSADAPAPTGADEGAAPQPLANDPLGYLQRAANIGGKGH